MIGRLALLVAGAVAAAAGAAAWAKRKADEDAALDEESLRDEAQPDATAVDAAQRAGAVDVAAIPVGDEPARDAGDDLTSLKGIGAVSEERLAGIGVTTFAQIASWSDEDLESVAARIKVSAERIRREDWVGQAKAAAESSTAG